MSTEHLMPRGSLWAGALVLLSILGASLALASAEDIRAKPAKPPREASAKKAAGDDEAKDDKTTKDKTAPATTAQPGFNTIEEIVALDGSWLLSGTEATAPAEVRWREEVPLNKRDERTARPKAPLSSTRAR